MFLFHYEYSLEFDIPLRVLWDYCENPSHWILWADERIVAYYLSGELKSDATIVGQMKYNRRDIYFPIKISEFIPYEQCSIVLDRPLFHQKCVTTYKELSPTRTKIKMAITLKSPFIPFCRSYCRKKAERGQSLVLKAIQENCKN